MTAALRWLSCRSRAELGVGLDRRPHLEPQPVGQVAAAVGLDRLDDPVLRGQRGVAGEAAGELGVGVEGA